MPTKTKTEDVRYIDDDGVPTAKSSQMILEYVLRKYGKTQGELARAMRLSPSYISRVVRGTRNLTLAHIGILSDFLKVPVVVLIWKGLNSFSKSTRKTAIDIEMESLLDEVYPGWVDEDDGGPRES